VCIQLPFRNNCWRDPYGEKHYKLRIYHLKALIEFVQQGNTLCTTMMFLMTFASSSTLKNSSGSKDSRDLLMPPLPAFHLSTSPTFFHPLILCQRSAVSTLDPALTAAHSRPSEVYLNIPGPRDLAVRRYNKWQQTQVVDENLKIEFQKACNVTLVLRHGSWMHTTYT
jgi:hypothetical protein